MPQWQLDHCVYNWGGHSDSQLQKHPYESKGTFAVKTMYM